MSRSAPSPAQQHGTSLATVFGGLMLGMLLSSSSTTIVAPAIPRIVADLGGRKIFYLRGISIFLLGSTVGTAILGTIQTQALLRELPRTLPPDVLNGVRDGLVSALQQVFLACMPFVLPALAASHCIKEVPLRRTMHESPPGEAGGDVAATHADVRALPHTAKAGELAD